jgi:hypothetical protein
MPSPVIMTARRPRALFAIVAIATALLCMACAEEAPATQPDGHPATEVTATPTLEAAASPSGILTFAADGHYISVPAVDPTHRLATVAVTSENHIAAHQRPTEAVSPDGRFEARVVTDEQGTRIDLTASGHATVSVAIAAPEGVGLVTEGKALARAVAGVPLTIAWSPDSKYLAFGSITGAPWALNLFSTASWSFSSYQVEGGYVGELSWSPDGSRLAISTYELERTNHTVLLLDVETHWLRRLIGGCIVSGRRTAASSPSIASRWRIPVSGSRPSREASASASLPMRSRTRSRGRESYPR